MGRRDISLDGMDATECAHLVEGDTPGAVYRWRRYLSGRAVMPVDALAKLAVARDAGPLQVHRWVHELASRRAA